MKKTSAETTTQKYEPISNVETIENASTKNYIDIWKRALRKIKLRKLLRFANDEYVFSQDATELVYSNRPRHLKTSFFIILPYNPWYVFWVIVLLIQMIYISTYGLFYSSFFSDENLLNELKYEIIVDVIFVVDMILSINLAFFDTDNKLIVNRKLITLRYLRKDCLIDTIVSVPFGILIKINQNMSIYEFFKYRMFLRLLKWLNLLKRLDYLYFIKTIDHFCSSHRTLMNLIYMSVILSLSLHIATCFLFLYNSLNTFSTSSMISKSRLLDFNQGEQYLTYLYWALTTLSTIGYGDFVPMNTEEKIICMAWMAAGVLVVSITVGQFNFLFNRLLASDSLLNENISLATHFCMISQIPINLSKRMKKYIRDNQIITYKLDVSKFLSSVDINMRYEIAINIYQNAITKIPFIIEKDLYFISFITFYMQIIRPDDNKLIWYEFSLPDGIYFISEGHLELFYEDKLFSICKHGDYTGDIEFFYRIKRKFDAYSGKNTEILKLSSQNMKIFKQNFPHYYEILKENTKERKNKLLHELAEMKLVRESIKRGNFVIDKEQLEIMKHELNHLLFCMKSEINSKKKFKEMLDKCLHIKNRIYKCRNLIKILVK